MYQDFTKTDWFCAPMIFKTTIKPEFLELNLPFNMCRACMLESKQYISYQRQTLEFSLKSINKVIWPWRLLGSILTFTKIFMVAGSLSSYLNDSYRKSLGVEIIFKFILQLSKVFFCWSLKYELLLRYFIYHIQWFIYL